MDPGQLIITMQRVAVLLKETGVPFALGGSLAVYARGGNTSEHDVDFLIRPGDVSIVVEAARAAGLNVVQPPEDWLVKVYDEDRLVDLIYRPVERWVTDELLAEATEMRVHAVAMPVLPATRLAIHKLLALSEHRCDFSAVLPMCRSLREQVDWDRVARDTGGSPYARALLYLLELLKILPVEAAAGGGRRPESGDAGGGRGPDHRGTGDGSRSDPAETSCGRGPDSGGTPGRRPAVRAGR